MMWTRRRRSAVPHGSRWLLAGFTLVVLAYCAWVLSLPLFPSQDGPLHLYYADVLGRMLSSTPGIYAKAYRLGHLVPPYALYYYLLLALSKFMSFALADKLIVCLTIVVNAFGFRYLARAMGAGGDRAAFLALPVLLTWPLAIGFVNFALSLGLALWALGLWTRFEAGRAVRLRVLFLVLAALITITHPVPLLLLVIMCSLDLLVRALEAVRAHKAEGFSWTPLATDALCLLLTIPAMVYVKQFTVAGKATVAAASWHRRVFDNLFDYLHGAGTVLFPDSALTATLYRFGFGLLFVLVLGVGLAHFLRSLRSGKWDVQARWFCFAAICCALLPLLPQEFNGAHFLGWRLATAVYLFAALGTATADASPRRMHTVLMAFAVVMSVYTLGLAVIRLGATARAIAVLDHIPAVAPGGVGLIEQGGPNPTDTRYSYRPYLWAGVHYVQRTNSILYNAAWLDVPILPLKRNEASHLIDALEDEVPPRLSTQQERFKPGAQWNPAEATFILLERISPEDQPKPYRPSWQKIAAPFENLDVSACSDENWYCIAVRR